MFETLVLWNEPNNHSRWNFHLDPEGKRFSEMVTLASDAIRNANPQNPIVLGGISACDCAGGFRVCRPIVKIDHDDTALIGQWQSRLKAQGVWVSQPVPMFPFPGSPKCVETFGAAPGEDAWERARAFYLGLFADRGYRDVQEQRSLPLQELEYEEGPCAS